jgi:predicted secreted protein
MLELDETAHGTEATLRVGQECAIRLLEQPSTGFQWELAMAGAPACALVGETVEPPSGVPGGPEHRTWRFQALRVGDGRIELRYRRPWETADPADPTERRFSLRLRVLP